uniref:Uncharacterized protein n=1 Tax=Sphaerodactylus townsendi TaxID=933632 RepID=A0ACB8G7R1_9SAUR
MLLPLHETPQFSGSSSPPSPLSMHFERLQTSPDMSLILPSRRERQRIHLEEPPASLAVPPPGYRRDASPTPSSMEGMGEATVIDPRGTPTSTFRRSCSTCTSITDEDAGDAIKPYIAHRCRQSINFLPPVRSCCSASYPRTLRNISTQPIPAGPKREVHPLPGRKPGRPPRARGSCSPWSRSPADMGLSSLQKDSTRDPQSDATTSASPSSNLKRTASNPQSGERDEVMPGKTRPRRHRVWNGGRRGFRGRTPPRGTGCQIGPRQSAGERKKSWVGVGKCLQKELVLQAASPALP